MRVVKLVLMLSVVGLIAADEPKSKKKDDAEAIKGKWKAVSMKMGKQSTPEEFLKTFRCQFDEKTYNNTVSDEVIEEGSFTIDSSKTPKTIDFDIKKGHDEGKKQLGVYKLEGDKLTIVLTRAGSTERPKSLEPEEGSEVIEVVLEKVKP
jgi:uncharacterized protein (TIGR03067 family)